MMLNWIDWIIAFLVVYEIVQGWKAGFVALGITFISFAVSLWLAVLFRMPVAQFFADKFGIASVWSSALSYIGITLVTQMILIHTLSFVISKFPPKIEKSKLNNIFGAIISGVNSLTTIAFVLVVILALPLKGTVQKDIRASTIGGAIVSLVEKYGGPIKTTLNEVKQTAARFVTVNPNSKDSMPIDASVTEKDLSVDDQAERQLLELVNKERTQAGIPALVVDVRIVSAARSHSKDMFIRKYFSHYTPDGKNLGDRLKASEVPFSQAGENIAYAPDVDLAHQGLMNSPEHKRNLMDPIFRHVGIGIIASEKYGLMITEDFVN